VVQIRYPLSSFYRDAYFSTFYSQTVSAINAFLKAMILFPEVQAAAQAEIDSVIGSNRLPGFADKDKLPYLNAVVLELLRFHSVVPTGEAQHFLIQDIS
jgi:cytochrome P450